MIFVPLSTINASILTELIPAFYNDMGIVFLRMFFTFNIIKAKSLLSHDTCEKIHNSIG